MEAKPISKEDLQHILTNTRDVWREVKGSNFFITGGTGFFGRWILESFGYINDQLSNQMSATVLTRTPEAFAKVAPHLACRSDLKFHTGDIRNFKMPRARFSHIIHAATTSRSPVSPEEMTSVIVEGSRNILNQTNESGANRLLYISSGAVYGPQPTWLECVPEEYEGRPPINDSRFAYGQGKIQAEQLCIEAWKNGGPKPVMARCFAFVGPHLPLDAHFAIGNFISDILNDRPIRIGGDGTPLRSYLYAADLAIWLWTILFKGTAGGAYNVGSDVAISIENLANIVCQVQGITRRVIISKKSDPNGNIAKYIPNIDKAKSELGLTPLVDLAQGIQRTINWYRPAPSAGI